MSADPTAGRLPWHTGLHAHQTVTKKKVVFAVVLHRCEGLQSVSTDDTVAVHWQRGSSLTGRSKEALMTNDLITWEETFSLPVTLKPSEASGSREYEKKTLKLTLRQGGSKRRVAEVELDLTGYIDGCEELKLPLTLRDRERARRASVPETKMEKEEVSLATLVVSVRTREAGIRSATSGEEELSPLNSDHPIERHRLSKAVLRALVEAEEGKHPEWTSTAAFHHPELLHAVQTEIQEGLKLALVPEDAEMDVLSMSLVEAYQHFAPLVQLLGSVDQILSMGLLAMPLGEDQTDHAAGGLLGFFSEQEAMSTLLRGVVLQEIRTRGPSLDLFSPQGSHQCCIPTVIMDICIESMPGVTQYVAAVLGPAFDQAVSLDVHDRLDVERSEAIDRTHQVSEAVANMAHCVRKVVSAVCDSADEAPEFIQYVAFLIHQSMLQQHPDEPDLGNRVLCSFLVRRVFCPFLLDVDRLCEARSESSFDATFSMSLNNEGMGLAAMAEGSLQEEVQISKQVRFVLRVAARCLEAMASCEQLRTREGWVPEINSVLREHMSSLDNFKEDLIDVADGYHTRIGGMSDGLDLSESLDTITNISRLYSSDLSRCMAQVVMDQAYLNSAKEAQDDYVTQWDVLQESGDEDTTRIDLDPKEEATLNATIQAAQVYKQGLTNMLKNLGAWRVRDPPGRHMYNKIEDEIYEAQEANKVVLQHLGQLHCFFNNNEMSPLNISRTPCTPPIMEDAISESPQILGHSPTWSGRRSRPGTPLSSLEPLTPKNGRRSRPNTPVSSHTPVSGSRSRSRPHTPLSGSPAKKVSPRDHSDGSPVAGLEVIQGSDGDSRSQLNELISVVNAVAELYDDRVRYQRMDTLQELDPELSVERAAEKSNASLDHVVHRCRALSNFGAGFEAAIVIGGALLELMGDTAETMRKMNNMRAALAAKQRNAMEESGELPLAVAPEPEPEPEPEASQSPTVRSRIRRSSLEMISAIVEFIPGSTPQDDEPPREHTVSRAAINLNDAPVSEQDVKRCLDLLRDAHQLWKQLVKSSPDIVSKRATLKRSPMEEQLQESSKEICRVRDELQQLKRQWETQIAAGLPSIGCELCFEMLLENCTLRLGINEFTHELHGGLLERMRILEQHTVHTTTLATPRVLAAEQEPPSKRVDSGRASEAEQTTDSDSDSDTETETNEAEKIARGLASFFGLE